MNPRSAPTRLPCQLVGTSNSYEKSEDSHMLALDSSNLCVKPLLVSVTQPYLFEFFVGELWSGLDFVAWEDPFKVHPEQIV